MACTSAWTSFGYGPHLTLSSALVAAASMTAFQMLQAPLSHLMTGTLVEAAAAFPDGGIHVCAFAVSAAFVASGFSHPA